MNHPPTSPQPRLTTISSAHVESVPAEVYGWQGSWVQLDAGLANYRAARLWLDGVEVNRHACDSRLLGRWFQDTGAVSITWMVEGDRPARYAGRDVPAEQGILWHAEREHWTLFPSNLRVWELLVTAPIVEARGWQVAQTPLVPLSRQSRSHLEGAAQHVIAAARAKPATSAAVLRERILDAAETALRPLLLAPPQDLSDRAKEEARSLVREAAELARKAESLAEVRIPELAAFLGVSDRTLYAAFRRTVGVGPYEFVRLERLHQARRLLLAGPSHRGRVRECVADVGFRDPKRLSKVYRRQFGESPRETMRRRPDGSSDPRAG